MTLGAALGRRLSWHDAVGYWVAQFAGGIAGAGVLDLTLRSSPLWSKAIGLGADGYGSASMIHVSAGGAFLAEAILTAVFVFVILSVTGKAAPVGVAGLMIGLTLTVIHLFGIPVTGTSVNPARSLGPAVFLGGTALHQVWLFLVAPLVGGALAAALYRGLHGRPSSRSLLRFSVAAPYRARGARVARPGREGVSRRASATPPRPWRAARAGRPTSAPTARCAARRAPRTA